MTGSNWERIMSSGRCAATVVTVMMLAGASLCAENIRKDLHFKVGNHPTISINNPYGPVVVKAGAAHEISVTAILHSDKVELDQSKSRNRVDIVSHLLPGGDASSGIVEYEILVPPDANLTLHSDNGRIHAEKLQGDLTVVGNSGAIEVVDCSGGHLPLRTFTGPASPSHVHGGGGGISLSGDRVMSGGTQRTGGAESKYTENEK